MKEKSQVLKSERIKLTKQKLTERERERQRQRQRQTDRQTDKQTEGMKY